MSDTDIINVRIESAQEMRFLGQSFGLRFLRPLVEGGDCTVHNPVVALYGAADMGKSAFVRAAASPFPSFYHAIKSVSHQHQCAGIRLQTQGNELGLKDS